MRGGCCIEAPAPDTAHGQARTCRRRPHLHQVHLLALGQEGLGRPRDGVGCRRGSGRGGEVGSERASERRRRQQAAAAACRTLRAGTPSGFLTHARSRSGRKCGLKQLACAAANPARPERPPGLAPRSGCAAKHRRHLRSTSRRPPTPPARSVRRQQTRCCPWLENRCGGDQGEGWGLTARKLRNRP